MEEKAVLEMLKAGRAIGDLKAADGQAFAVIPDSYNLRALAPLIDQYGEKPFRIREGVAVQDAESFAAYFKRFGNPHATIFADLQSAKFNAILDYHGTEMPSHCTHKLHYVPRRSREWTRWTGINGDMMPQKVFAEFVEENMADIVEPPAAVLMEVATHLQAKKTGGFMSSKKLEDGSTVLEYADKVEDAQTKTGVPIPSVLTLGIPVFENDQAYRVKAHLRFRIDTQGEFGKPGLYFKVDLHRADFIADDAFKSLMKTIAENLPDAAMVLGTTSGQQDIEDVPF